MVKSPEEIDEIVRNMSVMEKIRCCALYQDRFGNVERLGTAYRCCDNPSGGWSDYFRLSREEIEKAEHFWGTSFPQAAAVGAAWNPELARQIGEAQGKECRKAGINIILRPGVNMKRSPLNGRNFEYYSEDPWLTSELAASYINGVQSMKVGANLKHYACNNQEYERMTTNAVVDERTLNELYLRVFQLVLQKSAPWTLMTSYNKINGKWAFENKYVMDRLQKDFGFDGLVMSDAFAVHYEEDKIAGHICGLDAELAEEDNHVDLLLDAFNTGAFPEEVLDRIARRVLTCYYKTCVKDEPVPEVDLAAHHALARKAAAEGAVLLENDGILPLDENCEKKIAVIGAFAREPSNMGGGSGHMNGHTLDIPYDELEKVMGKDSFAYAEGYQIEIGFPPGDVERSDLVAEAAELAKEADLLILFTGYPYGVEGEGYSRPDLMLPKSQRDMLDAVLAVNTNAILIVNTGAPVDLSAYKNKVRAILQGGYAGEAAGGAAVDILFGKSEPGGRLPETYPARVQDTPSYLSFPKYPDVMPDVVYGEGIYIGYRWYDAKDLPVQYPFGYGLSYTTFAYSDLKTDVSQLDANGSVTVSFKVKNTGKRAGSDVAQIYVHDVVSGMNRPVKELRAFQKVFLQPGEEQEVSLTLDRRAFEFYTPALHRWVVEEGDFEIMLGRSSRDILDSVTVTVHSKDKLKRFSGKTQIGDFIKDPRFKDAISGAEEKVRDFLDPDKNPVLPLGVAIPFGQFCDADIGQGKLPKALIQDVCAKLNEE